MRLGEWDLSLKRDCQHGLCADAAIDIRIKEIILHDGYAVNAIDHQHDIALVLLNHSVKMTQWIKPICLPSSKMHNFRTENFEHISMDVAGWGYTSTLPNGIRLFLKVLLNYMEKDKNKLKKYFSLRSNHK